MQNEEIQSVINQFADAAKRAETAGFDGSQIHAAHLFFLSRFISPAINHRQDEFGGSTQNRCRILTDIIKEIRKKSDKLNISVKLNSDDFTNNGITPDECIEICRLLDSAGIDPIEISGNDTSRRGIIPLVNGSK